MERYVCNEHIWTKRNNFAISTEGILDAFKGGGAVLSEYGVSLTETVALITGANKTLQDPSVVKFFWRFKQKCLLLLLGKIGHTK